MDNKNIVILTADELESVLMNLMQQVLEKPENPAVDRLLTVAQAAEMLGVRADECLYVGDGGSKELYAARNMRFISKVREITCLHCFHASIPCGIEFL